RVSGADDDGTIRLLRQLAGFERNLAPADRHADVGPALSGNCHQLSSTLLLRESGDSSQRRQRRSLESPPSLVTTGLPAQPQFLDQCSVPLQVVLLQVRQEAPSPADELQQPAA